MFIPDGCRKGIDVEILIGHVSSQYLNLICSENTVPKKKN